MANLYITLSLAAELVGEAKIHAASRGMATSAYARSLLERDLSKKDRVRNAGWRFLEIGKGLHSDVEPATIRREDLYERW